MQTSVQAGIMANYVYIACSMDGYIARKDGGINWLTGIPNDDNSDYGFGAFMQTIDGVLMGRNTFETVLGFNLAEWPYGKPVFVLSGSLTDVPDALRGKVEIINSEPEDAARALNRKGINNIYVDGGKTIQGFMKKGLIDVMIITTISIVLGGGIPLFGETGRETSFVLEKTEYLNKFMVKNYYRKIT
jgi:dihydrofolate reductase